MSNFNYRWTRCFFVFSFASLYRILFSQSLFLFGKEKKKKKDISDKVVVVEEEWKNEGDKDLSNNAMPRIERVPRRTRCSSQDNPPVQKNKNGGVPVKISDVR